MPKKNHKYLAQKVISNKILGIFIVFILFGSSAWLYFKFFAPDSQQQWLKMQTQNMGQVISELVNNEPEAAKLTSANSAFIPILMYHHVGPLPANADALRKDMTVSADNFELQVAWLKGQGYESIKLGDLLGYKLGKFILPSKPVIFTFDDGYSDVFEYAVPILKKYGFTGDFAIITQFTGITQGTNRYASWQQIKQAQKDGMEMVSHTQDHFDGTSSRYDAGFILRNLNDSQKDLQNNTGKTLPILIYPFGHFNQQYIELAKQAKFEIGVTTQYGQKINIDDMLRVPRVRVHGGDDLEQFKLVIQKGEQESGNSSLPTIPQ